MKILVAGDFCPQGRVAEFFEKGDYCSVLKEVKPIVEQSDCSIVNLECPVCKGGEKPIEKCGPNLKCSEHGVLALKWAGFDCVTLANNHFFDFGVEGVKNTLEACKRNNLDTVGGGDNLQAASLILYKEIDGKTLAIINCCEHEFSIATENTAGSNPLNPIKQYYAIKEAHENADFVLVVVHGGHEHYQLPSTRMQETYRFFIDAGADAVINHHQHCYSGYEQYKGKPIVYGLGNFCFDEGIKEKKWHEGFMVMLTSKENVSIQLFPYIQCAEDAVVKMTSPDDFDISIKKYNQIISSEKALRKEQDCYYKSNQDTISNVFNPVVNRYLRFLQRQHIIPNIISKKWLTKMHNYIMCEAHRDKLLYFLSHNEC